MGHEGGLGRRVAVQRGYGPVIRQQTGVVPPPGRQLRREGALESLREHTQTELQEGRVRHRAHAQLEGGAGYRDAVAHVNGDDRWPEIRLEGTVNLVVLLIILLLLFGGGGFYLGGPVIGGSLGGLILLVLIVMLVTGRLGTRA